MKLPLSEWFTWPETKTIIQALNGSLARFVGGAVRDSVLGITVKDVDLVTDILPDRVMVLLATAGIRAIPTGIDHGTVTAVIGKRHFEITTLRRDISTDGRRAVVAYTDNLREDAERRDFTMNALYADAEGEITDFFNGYEDALHGRVRFIGNPDERIREDALRILRFFRFLAFYSKEPADRQALEACTKAAATLDALSGERIQQEMLKLLAAKKAADTIELMQTHGILRYVIPQNVSTTSLAKLPQILESVRIENDAILGLVLLLRTQKNRVEQVEAIYNRWKLSKANYYRLMDLCKPSQVNITSTNEKFWKKNIRHLGKHDFISHAIIAMAESGNMETGLQAVKLASHWQIPTFPLTGNDLIMQGIKPGKDMGVLLEQLETLWEENGYTMGKEELLKSVSA